MVIMGGMRLPTLPAGMDMGMAAPAPPALMLPAGFRLRAASAGAQYAVQGRCKLEATTVSPVDVPKQVSPALDKVLIGKLPLIRVNLAEALCSTTMSRTTAAASMTRSCQHDSQVQPMTHVSVQLTHKGREVVVPAGMGSGSWEQVVVMTRGSCAEVPHLKHLGRMSRANSGCFQTTKLHKAWACQAW